MKTDIETIRAALQLGRASLVAGHAQEKFDAAIAALERIEEELKSFTRKAAYNARHGAPFEIPTSSSDRSRDSDK